MISKDFMKLRLKPSVGKIIVMNEYFEKFIEKKLNELYPFAFALVPDDLQASQLVIDAINLMQVDSDISPKLVYYYQDQKKLSEDRAELTNSLISHIYRLAKRRTAQLSGSYIIPKGFGAFYQTPMNERAILFLRDKYSLSFERIAKIIGSEKVETIQNFHLGMNSVHEFLGSPVEIS